MPIEYRIDTELRAVVRRIAGEIDRPELELHWRDMLSDPDVPEPIAILTDMREANVRLTHDEVQGMIRNIIRPALAGRKWISALVVASPLQFGQTRQFMAYTDECGWSGLFYDPDEAREWLLRTAAEPGIDH